MELDQVESVDTQDGEPGEVQAAPKESNTYTIRPNFKQK